MEFINEYSQIRWKRNNTYTFFKRIIDICGSIIGIIIFSPLLLVVAIAIKLEEPSSPIIYSQWRMGKYSKKFRMYKFRSMYVNADERLQEIKQYNEKQNNIMFKMKNDPRVTKVGKVIRKLSLDELPQFFNVLKGEMSLVGPRPPLEHEVEQYDPFDVQRLLIKPGCTGLWQVTGRNNLTFKEMIKLDVYYIQKQSLIFDCYLIIKTIKVMFLPNDVY
jgi:lipopolysaccharide/colanic/teichoic acid biosynthesis glycosyltransferase